MPISHQYKIIFIHIPKNAGTSIEKTLNMQDTGHKRWDYYQQKYPEQWSSYKKIAVLRDPVERLISCYEYAKLESSYWHSTNGPSTYGKHPDYDICSKMSFKEVIAGLYRKKIKLMHAGWRTQCNWIINETEIMVDETIMLDSVSNWFRYHSLPALPKLNKSTNKNKTNYTDYIDLKTLKRIKKLYHQDYVLLNKINTN